MIQILVGVFAVLLALAVFWLLGHILAVLAQQDSDGPEKMGIGFTLVFLIILALGFCYGVGTLIMKLL